MTVLVEEPPGDILMEVGTRLTVTDNFLLMHGLLVNAKKYKTVVAHDILFTVFLLENI